jgi:hypothetical protein
MRKLVGGLMWLRGWDTAWQVPTASALCQARQRLGEEPLRALFERVAQPILPAGGGRGWYASLRVMALDGVIIDVPDTAENVAEFGRTGNHLADSPYPQARIVTLLECGSRAVLAAEIGPCHTGERELAQGLLNRLDELGLDEHTLLLADRGFYGYEFFKTAASNAELLWRVNRRITLPVHRQLPDGSYLSALAPKGMHGMVARGQRRRSEHLEVPVRVVEYTITNRGPTADDPEADEPETIRLITSILDHELAPAAELAALYHQRWEIELAFDEIETHQMGHPRVLRSRSPQMVRQETWALLLTHYAIRHLMFEAADDIDTDPDRISFLRTLRIVRRQVTDQAAFSPQQTHHND